MDNRIFDWKQYQIQLWNGRFGIGIVQFFTRFFR